MARERGFDSEAIREEEREIETRASQAGKGPIGDSEEEDSGMHAMPSVEKDGAEAMCQRAANSAREYNQRGESDKQNEPGEGTGTEVY